jgi:hypothetical protein
MKQRTVGSKKRGTSTASLGTVTELEVVAAKTRCWESFFRCQKSPILRSQMLTTLMAGTPLQMEHLPMASLLDALLLAFTARTYCEAELIDDYEGLKRRTDDTWKRADWTTKMFDSIHVRAANFIILGSEELAACEEAYIPTMVAWYLGHDVPQYFAHELETDAEVKAHRRRAV